MPSASIACSPPERRAWIALVQAGRSPPRPGASQARQERPGGRGVALTELRPAESFFGYPGPCSCARSRDQIAQGDGGDVARLVQRINGALLSNSYRPDASDWETSDDAAEAPERSACRRAWILVRHAGRTSMLLIVSPAPPARCGPGSPRICGASAGRKISSSTRRSWWAARGRIPGGALQRRHPGRGDRRRVPLPVPLRHADPCTTCSRPSPASIADAGVPQEYGTRLAGAIKRVRPELDIYLLSRRNVDQVAGDPAVASSIRRVFCESRGAAGDPSERPSRASPSASRRRTSTTSSATPQQPDRHLPRPADRPRQVDLQVELDPRHGRVLRARRCSWPSPRPRPAVSTACSSPPAPSSAAQDMAARAFGCRPGVLRHQRHVDVEQDGRARRCWVRATSSSSTATATSRTTTAWCWPGAQPYYVEAFPMTALLDVRRRCRSARSRRRCSSSRPPAGSTEVKHGHAHQLHLRRPRLQHTPRDGGVPRDQAGPGLPVGRGVVRVRALLAVPAGRARRWVRRADIEAWLRPIRPCAEALRRAGAAARRRSRSRRTSALLDTRLDARSAQRCGCACTRPTRRTSRCRRCARARWCWCATSTTTTSRHSSRRRCSPTPRRRRTYRSSPPLDVARRQMELEGYELVARSIRAALDIRRAVRASHP